MTIAQTDQPTRKPLRLWPGVAAVALQWLVRFVLPILLPAVLMFAVLGGLVGGLVVVLWWAFLSRAPRAERWGAPILIIPRLGGDSSHPR